MGKLFRRSNGMVGIFMLLALTLFLIGCGAGRTMVLAPPTTTTKFMSAEIYEDKATVAVPADVSASFQEKLSQLLFGEGGFARGPDLKIRYRFIQFNPGSQFSRWFWGGIGSAGKGTMTVEPGSWTRTTMSWPRFSRKARSPQACSGGLFNWPSKKPLMRWPNSPRNFIEIGERGRLSTKASS